MQRIKNNLSDTLQYKITFPVWKNQFIQAYRGQYNITKENLLILRLDSDDKMFQRLKRELEMESIQKQKYVPQKIQLIMNSGHIDIVVQNNTEDLIQQMVIESPLFSILQIHLAYNNYWKLIRNKQIINRDFTLGNVFSDQNYNVSIIDYGIAKQYFNKLKIQGAGQNLLLQHYSVFWPLSYLTDKDEEDNWVYSLGIMMVVLIFGKDFELAIKEFIRYKLKQPKYDSNAIKQSLIEMFYLKLKKLRINQKIIQLILDLTDNKRSWQSLKDHQTFQEDKKCTGIMYQGNLVLQNKLQNLPKSFSSPQSKLRPKLEMMFSQVNSNLQIRPICININNEPEDKNKNSVIQNNNLQFHRIIKPSLSNQSALTLSQLIQVRRSSSDEKLSQNAYLSPHNKFQSSLCMSSSPQKQRKKQDYLKVINIRASYATGSETEITDINKLMDNKSQEVSERKSFKKKIELRIRPIIIESQQFQKIDKDALHKENKIKNIVSKKEYAFDNEQIKPQEIPQDKSKKLDYIPTQNKYIADNKYIESKNKIEIKFEALQHVQNSTIELIKYNKIKDEDNIQLDFSDNKNVSGETNNHRKEEINQSYDLGLDKIEIQIKNDPPKHPIPKDNLELQVKIIRENKIPEEKYKTHNDIESQLLIPSPPISPYVSPHISLIYSPQISPQISPPTSLPIYPPPIYSPPISPIHKKVSYGVDVVDFANNDQPKSILKKQNNLFVLQKIQKDYSSMLKEYQKGLVSYNLIGETVVKAMMYLNALSNLWVIPLFIIFKRMYQLRIQIEEGLENKENYFQCQDFDDLCASPEFITMKNKVKSENIIINGELKKILSIALSQMKTMSDVKLKKIQWFMNDDVESDIKDTAFVYAIVQILPQLNIQAEKSLKNDNSRPKYVEWLQLQIEVLCVIILMENPLMNFPPDQFDYELFQTSMKDCNREQLNIYYEMYMKVVIKLKERLLLKGIKV